MTMVWTLVEVGTTFDAEPRAVLPTQRLERQIKDHRVAEQRLEVDEIALQPADEIIVWLDTWVHVQFLDLDLQLI